jgi:hypothetical protein
VGAQRDAYAAPAVLVVTMGTDYVAPARMPCELQRAGFRVGVLAPRRSFAARTRFAEQVDVFPEPVRLHEWLALLAGAVDALRPALILPGDDVTVRTMMQVVLEPPQRVAPDALRAVEPLIRASLGGPASWLDTIDKSRLFRLAEANAIPVAEGGIAATDDEAIAIADALGYPVMLRPSFGSAGEGAARCDARDAVRAAMQTPKRDDGWTPRGAGDAARFVVQRWIDGDVVNRASLAWHGSEIAGFTRGRLATHPGPLGPASVVQFAGVPRVRDATVRLFALTGMHGLVGTQFIIERATGTPYLIEVNRRMLPATHSGSLVGVDLAAALFDIVSGRRWDGPVDLPPGPSLRLALFPQEWYRDSASGWLQTLPSDAPWHDPDVLAAMLRLPFETAVPPP